MEMENSATPPALATELGAASQPAALTAETVFPAAASTPGVERLALQLGQLHLLCAPDTGREVILPPAVSRLPHTPDWLLGVANVRGAMLPVLDLARACGTEHHARLRRYVLIIGDNVDQLGLLVDGLPVLRRFELAERLATPTPPPPMLDGLVLDTYAQGNAEWIEINLEGLLVRIGELIANPDPASRTGL